MSPNFFPDSFVLAVLYPWQSYTVGDVVLINHHKYGKIIKRISSMQTDNTGIKTDTTSQPININKINSQKLSQTNITLIGDNLESITKAQMGIIKGSQVIGKVIYQVKPPQQN